MEFVSFNPLTVNYDTAYLDWELSTTLEDLNDYVFVIRRGNVQSQLDIIDVLSSSSSLYIDTAISGIQYDKHLHFYYQIEALNLVDSTKSIHSPTKSLNEPELHWAAKEIIRRDTIGLQNVLGQQFTLLKLRHSGTQCSCWDYTLGSKSIPGPCYTCYDTNWVGGYYDPVTIYGSLGPWGETSTISPQGDQKDSVTMFITTYYPKLNVNDVIVDTSGNRWRITNLGTSRFNTAQIKQIVQVSMIDRNDLVYKLTSGNDDSNDTLMETQTSEEWFTSNPILGNGLFGFESDTLKLKIGDGETLWNDLAYLGPKHFILMGGRYEVGTLVGDINGINKTFTTLDPFISNTTMIFINGLKQRNGHEYIEQSPNTIIFETAPTDTDGVKDKLEILQGVI